MDWISDQAAVAMHHESIREHGGAAGIRDRLLLESALARPRNLYEYEEADVFRLAAAYAFGICRNHPFIDGNKRTGFLVMYAFLSINGQHLTASQPDAAVTFIELASGAVTEHELAEWIRANSEPST